ncbi:PREDICTED: uncharacterized protein LOC108771587 [Cyphomyrmex costatus]|uniref:uncharacterized protein LOC108771587 n=1 Tax=Cyphomyrmex costatus TaxID=456900 RepID=UPI0008523280|nr:PREDICTED: uncharacterized protein LOC108771587 [Cyphomyrmex costatus]
MNKSSNSDFLSQSYFQGIERITRTKSSAFNLQISEELLKVRKKIWDNLLDKYSKEMSDDKEINIYTLELEEDEENEKEKVVSEEEYSCEQRVYMPKPAIFIQYWINTVL